MTAQLLPVQVRRNAWLAYLGSVVAMTGVQLVSPALPVMRQELGLSELQVSLVMSVYLFPGVAAAIPMGILADRWGRRPVFGWSLVAFGLLGATIPLVGAWLWALLAFRFLQGICFAALLPLTMTILGDTFRGNDLVRSQGNRSVAMNIGDGLLPALGGLLILGAWYLPWLLQLMAVPMGILVLWLLTDVERAAPATGGHGINWSQVFRLFRTRPIVVLEYVGFLRLFIKFAMLTFLPIFLVEARGMSPSIVGALLGASAVVGTAMALLAGRMGNRGSATGWIGISIFLMGVAVALMVLAPWVWAIVGAFLLYGAADGFMGVFSNSLVAAATDYDQRAAFVAATGAVRNAAKFLAPTSFGLLVMALSTVGGFVLLAGVTCISALFMGSMAPLEKRLADAVGPVAELGHE